MFERKLKADKRPNTHLSILGALFPIIVSIKDIIEENDLADIQNENFCLANDPVAYANFLNAINKTSL